MAARAPRAGVAGRPGTGAPGRVPQPARGAPPTCRLRALVAGLAAVLAAVLAAGLAACEAPPAVSRIVPGDALPEFSLAALDGQPVDSGRWRGRAVVLNFWATWCAPCRAEMPDLQRLSERFAETELVVVGVSVDRDLNLVREFLLRHGIRFVNLSDPDLAVATGRFALAGFPVTFLVGRDGRVREVVAGPRPWAAEEVVQRVAGELGAAALPAGR